MGPWRAASISGFAKTRLHTRNSSIAPANALRPATSAPMLKYPPLVVNATLLDVEPAVAAPSIYNVALFVSGSKTTAKCCQALKVTARSVTNCVPPISMIQFAIVRQSPAGAIHRASAEYVTQSGGNSAGWSHPRFKGSATGGRALVQPESCRNIATVAVELCR